MNLTDQLGALESSLDELILAAASIPVSPESSTASIADAAIEPATAAIASVVEEKPPVAEEKPALNVSRPEKNLITMTIGGVSVALSPEGYRS